MSSNYFDIRMKNCPRKPGGRMVCTSTTTVEIQKKSKGSRTFEKKCTTSVIKTSGNIVTERSTSEQKFHSEESVDPFQKDDRHRFLRDSTTWMPKHQYHGSDVVATPPGLLKSSSKCETRSSEPSPLRSEEVQTQLCDKKDGNLKESEELESKRTLKRVEGAENSSTIVQTPLENEVSAVKTPKEKNEIHSVVETPEDRTDIRTESSENSVTDTDSRPYVGLVNQAMTCYLNSLLQTLYMTPEFRNALYRWEYINKKEESAKSIPFQLQKLFLQLQMSKKPAIGTTDLTKSFGWDSNEAWQQQDVQELCRVMFDALEQNFAKTDQADLISRLYEGKMKDYVKCLECGYESAREDTFLDVPLVVRPFGSVQAYGSVEEALQAFVSPETLVDSNQYFCEKCSKKCDAHKGLKFMRLPYLLTLQLKRFDFDPATMHRIKLNDKVTFPQVLNLNEFVKSESEIIGLGKLDIMMDSGSGFEEDASFKGSSTPSRDDEGEIMDIDEGIDVSSKDSQEPSYDEKNLNGSMEKLSGPYMYELFSIMVHSGSANGGHYYAYIKSFTEGDWYCFNDMQVTKITSDDIKRTYGGGPVRDGYSSSYSSSANAYMLMYRQIDKERNAVSMHPASFPSHVKKLVDEVAEAERIEQEKLEREKALCKIKVFCIHPSQKTLTKVKLMVDKDTSLADTAGTAYEMLRLDGLVPLDCCRLVKYDEFDESIEYSMEESAASTIGEVLGGLPNNSNSDFLLEIKKPDEEFAQYKPGGIVINLHIVDLDTEEFLSSVTFKSILSQTVRELKQHIAKVLDLQTLQMSLVLEKCLSLTPLLNSDSTLADEGFSKKNKVFVEHKYVEEAKNPFENSKFKRLLDVYEHTISVTVTLPKVDKEFLEKQARCETLKNGDCEDEPKENGHCESNTLQDGKTVNSDHSENSSLSSLTDSERTLVGDEISPRSISPIAGEGDEEYWDAHLGFGGLAKAEAATDHLKFFFKVVPQESSNGSNSVRVVFDARITLSGLKKCLEPYVGVGSDYFKLYRVYSNNQEFECTRLNENMMSYAENSVLAVKLGKALQKGEYRVKVYQLTVNDLEPCKHFIDWVFAKGMTVLSAKKELLPEVVAKTGTEVPLERLRLRKKKWKNPGAVFRDDQKFEVDIPINPNWEVFLEILPEPERVTSSAQLSVFLRVWHPSSYQLSPLTEIVLNDSTFEELKLKSSEVSGIPMENLEFTKGLSTFPCEMYPLTMQTEMQWYSSVIYFNGFPLYLAEDGCVLCCRDKTEEVKELTEEERKTFSSKDTTCGRTATSKPYFSPHKEKALKIYTQETSTKDDLPPKAVSGVRTRQREV